MQLCHGLVATRPTLAAVVESAIPLPVVLDTERSIQITGLAGLDPRTYGLGNRRSIRLSYSPMRKTRIGIMGCESRRGDRDRRPRRLRKVRAPQWPGLLGNAQGG